MCLDGNSRVQFKQALSRHFGLKPAHVACPIEELAVEVGKFYRSEVENAEFAHARPGQVFQHQRPKSACADHGHFGGLDLFLALGPYARYYKLP